MIRRLAAILLVTTALAPALALAADDPPKKKDDGPALPAGASNRLIMQPFAASAASKDGQMVSIHMELTMFVKSPEAQLEAAARQSPIIHEVIRQILTVKADEFYGPRGVRTLTKLIVDIMKKQIGAEGFHSFCYRRLFRTGQDTTPYTDCKT
jgi:hypothetical protein